MKDSTLCFFVVSAFLFGCLMVVPVQAGAAQANKLTKEVMAAQERNGSSEPEKNEIQITNPDKKKEVQIKLGDEFKAYVMAAKSPFTELNGKPDPGNFRAMFGLHIPLK